LRWVGGLIWDKRRRGVFAIGSQGIEYALVAHWRAKGMLESSPDRAAASKEAQMVAVSGSISAITAAQTDWAESHGFELIQLHAEAGVDDRLWKAEVESAIESARVSLSGGRSPLVITARGPNDHAVARFREKVLTCGCDPGVVNARIGAGLGEILSRVTRETGIKRGAVSGGETSGFAMSALGAYALEVIAPIAPGAPLCRVFSPDPQIDGLQLSLKGGQMDEVDFFGSVRAGRASS
jgi:uncharacterized protein YgbK (DUF1537 family)